MTATTHATLIFLLYVRNELLFFDEHTLCIGSPVKSPVYHNICAQIVELI